MATRARHPDPGRTRLRNGAGEGASFTAAAIVSLSCHSRRECSPAMRASVTPGGGDAPNRYSVTPRRPPEACHCGAEIRAGWLQSALDGAGARRACGAASRGRAHRGRTREPLALLLACWSLSAPQHLVAGGGGSPDGCGGAGHPCRRPALRQQSVPWRMRPARRLHPGARVNGTRGGRHRSRPGAGRWHR